MRVNPKCHGVGGAIGGELERNGAAGGKMNAAGRNGGESTDGAEACVVGQVRAFGAGAHVGALVGASVSGEAGVETGEAGVETGKAGAGAATDSKASMTS